MFLRTTVIKTLAATVALSALLPAPGARAQSAASVKKGIGLAERRGLGAAQLKALNAAWYYNWARKPSWRRRRNLCR
jgi:hypothetical protein